MFALTNIRRPARYDTSSRDGISRSRSFLKHYANPLEDWVHFWPKHPATYRKKMGEYAVEIQRVSMQLMDAILQGLGLRPMYLQEKLEKGMQFLALNNYPQFSHQVIRSDWLLIRIMASLPSCCRALQGLKWCHTNITHGRLSLQYLGPSMYILETTWKC